MKITVNFDGGEFERNLRRAVSKAVDERAGRVRGKVCRVHGKPAQVSRTSDGYSIKACCDAFAAVIREELSR